MYDLTFFVDNNTCKYRVKKSSTPNLSFTSTCSCQVLRKTTCGTLIKLLDI